LIDLAKAICQDRKDFNSEIKNIRHNLMLNEYKQEFVDSVMKASRSNRPSNTIYQALSSHMLRVPPRNSDALETVFKTKHTFRGTLMKTGPVRDAQQTKQYVYNNPCDCGKCYMTKHQAMKAKRGDESTYVLLVPFDFFISEGNILNINRVRVWLVQIIVLDVLVKRKVLTHPPTIGFRSFSHMT
jgi:hypothetical protein